MGCITTAADTKSTATGQSPAASGNAPLNFKVIPLHKDKKPTVLLEDFVDARDLFSNEDFGPSFGCFKAPQGVRLRYTKQHPFLETIMLSYMHHLPLCLSPDDVWTVVLQGFGLHMEKNAEKLRKKFVDFEGQKTIKVYRSDGFLINSNADWEGCFKDYSDQIKQNIGVKNHFNLVPKFSTTGKLEQAVFDSCLMKCMDMYFVYSMSGGCGIPEVKMLGTLDDWLTLRKKIEGLKEYDLIQWVNALLPIID